MIRVGIPSFGTDNGRSGIGSYLRELLIRFDDPRYDDEFSFELIGPQADRDCYLTHTKRIGWYPTEGVDRSPIRNFFWNQLSLPGLCRNRGYDLLFLPAANRRLPGRAPCPTVGTVHDLASLHIADKYDTIHRIFNRRILPALIRRLDQVLTVSAFSRDDIVRFARFPVERITVTHLAANAETFTPAEDRRTAAELIGTRYGFEPPYILYISRLEHPGKNHVMLIEAFTRLLEAHPELRLTLVLPGPAKERAQEIYAAAEASAVSSRIVFPGFIDARDLPDFYRGAEVFVLPSRFEGFGLPVLEAMACGTPVITSTAASLPEVSGPHAPHVDPDSPDELCLALEQVLTNEERRSELIRSGLEWAAGFSWEKTAEETLAVFRKTVKM
jgi:glycosyltransferase involved in cell wall biosynthesis